MAPSYQDLCNGIYIARIQHLLKTEFKLYYQAGGAGENQRQPASDKFGPAQLMNLFRSPELLLTVTGTFGAQKIDGEVERCGICPQLLLARCFSRADGFSGRAGRWPSRLRQCRCQHIKSDEGCWTGADSTQSHVMFTDVVFSVLLFHCSQRQRVLLVHQTLSRCEGAI